MRGACGVTPPALSPGLSPAQHLPDVPRYHLLAPEGPHLAPPQLCRQTQQGQPLLLGVVQSQEAGQEARQETEHN